MNTSVFPEIKKNFGFGGMRMPQKDGEIDYAVLSEMIDTFMKAGFNYFDTAHGYHGGASETAFRECLVKRYPRESFVLTNKLSGSYFKTESDIVPFFENQLKDCGVDYFDFYLMHAQTDELFKKYKACRAYETAFELKKAGKVRHVGISFHDKASVLDKILTEYPELEAVQIQFNYLDFEDASVESRKCYEVCRKHDKPVIVMEPVKGGHLVNLPEAAKRIYESLGTLSPASYAIRFAAGFEGMFMTLSGMSNMEQLLDNLSYMTDFKPLSEVERKAVGDVTKILRSQNLISCTACRYCVEGCPMGIKIPDLFACMNTKKALSDWNAEYYYNDVHTKSGGKASDCIGCGRCEAICPQHLEIISLLKDVAEIFDKK